MLGSGAKVGVNMSIRKSRKTGGEKVGKIRTKRKKGRDLVWTASISAEIYLFIYSFYYLQFSKR